MAKLTLWVAAPGAESAVYDCLVDVCGRLFGSYEALNGGHIEEALVDFTGGISYRVNLTRKRDLPSDLFAWLQALDKMSTLMGCSINVSSLPTDGSRFSTLLKKILPFNCCFLLFSQSVSFQCFDAVGWVAGRAPGL